MSTRCTIHFHYGDKANEHVEAIVYRHSDGYPDSVLPDLERFFEDVRTQTTDTRFDDPWHLAAKYIVWEALQYNAERMTKPLDFLGVAPMLTDPGDIEYRYFVRCWDTNTPQVTWEDA